MQNCSNTSTDSLLYSLVPRPLPAFQWCTLGVAWGRGYLRTCCIYNTGSRSREILLSSHFVRTLLKFDWQGPTVHDLDTREAGAEIINVHKLSLAGKAIEHHTYSLRAQLIVCRRWAYHIILYSWKIIIWR